MNQENTTKKLFQGFLRSLTQVFSQAYEVLVRLLHSLNQVYSIPMCSLA